MLPAPLACEHLSMPARTVCIVCPSTASANNGNWRTAQRWQHMLGGPAAAAVIQQDQPCGAEAMLALHARRSADAVQRFRERCPRGGLAVVLTGTDLYQDLPRGDPACLRSLALADRLVVLQPAALSALPGGVREKARVILQSAPAMAHAPAEQTEWDFIAVGHLRPEKDPLTLMAAVRQLGDLPRLRVAHVGAALDPAFAVAARETEAACPWYRWLGPLAPDEARRLIARSRALVHMSRVEGGANVVIEALRSGTPVLASRIDGNLGLLGDDHPGFFEVGDAGDLAQAMRRFFGDPAFAGQLLQHGKRLSPRFAPEREADALRHLLRELIEPRQG